MSRIPRDFSKRDAMEQKFLLEDTWCDRCQKADLGMLHPIEFEENGVVIVEGRCRRCEEPIRTTVIIQERKEI